MKLRHWLLVYLICLHIVFILPSYYLLQDNELLLFAVEGFYIISFLVGIALIRILFKPYDLIATGTELIEEEDFISTLRPTGNNELDQLIAVFNTMLLKLRDERLQTEQQHHFLAKLINAIPSGIVMLDYDGHIESVNPAAERLFGKTTQSLAGKSVDSLGEPFQNTLHDIPDDQAIVVSYHGNRRLKVYKSQCIDRGFPRAFVLIEELTEEIRRSEKAAYETLIRMMSHEINNSVGAVSSLLQSSRNYADQITLDDRDDFKTAIDVSIDRLKNLNSFMRQYADIVHLPQPRLHETDIVALLKQCAAFFQNESDERSIIWHWQVGDRIPDVHCDKTQIEQVFINIMKNAMEAIESSGDIHIRCHTDINRVIISISDTGYGIPPQVKEQLFNPFFTTKDNGQGIGLTLVREILDRHRFHYAFESNRDRGATFTIIAQHTFSIP